MRTWRVFAEPVIYMYAKQGFKKVKKNQLMNEQSTALIIAKTKEQLKVLAQLKCASQRS